MSTLYLDHQNSSLWVKDGVLQLSRPDSTTVEKIPLQYLERIVLRSKATLCSSVLSHLTQSGISILVVSGRYGQNTACLNAGAHQDARRRWAQTLALGHENTAQRLAQNWVRLKLRRQLRTLRHIARNRADLRKAFFDAQHSLAHHLNTLTTATGPALAHETHSLPIAIARSRGIEGAAAAAYFKAYFQAFAPSVCKGQRSRRPPEDAVNAVLSLSYTLLYGLAHQACVLAGLDPALGALHTISYGRAALACDLMEPLRPVVDLWVWELFRQGTLRPEHFSHLASSEGQGACLLGKAGRALFYRAWQDAQKAHQRHLLISARQLAQALLEHAPLPSAWQTPPPSNQEDAP